MGFYDIFGLGEKSQKNDQNPKTPKPQHPGHSSIDLKWVFK